MHIIVLFIYSLSSLGAPLEVALGLHEFVEALGVSVDVRCSIPCVVYLLFVLAPSVPIPDEVEVEYLGRYLDNTNVLAGRLDIK